MDNIKQKRLDLENSIRNNTSEIATCNASLELIAKGEKVTHKKDYYEDRIELLERENSVLQSKLDSGAYLNEPAPGTVDLSPVVSAINAGFDKLVAAVTAPKQ